MKKLLSILSSVAVTATAATTVVSCTVPKTNIEVTFDGEDGKNGFSYDASAKTYTMYEDGKATDQVYTPEELDAAMNGNFAMMNQQFPVAMSFDQLNQALLNLVSFNQSLVVKTQKDQAQLKNFRDTFLGRDSDTVNSDSGIDTASVDGIKFNKIDDNNYYGAFQRTRINSLTGLLDLYNYVNDKNNGAKVLGAGANADVKAATDLFNDPNSDASQLMKHFANSKQNPAFTKIKYDLPLTTYNSQSQYIDGFADNTKAKDGDKLKLSDVTTDYLNNNTDVAMETSTTSGKGKNKATQNVTSKITDHANSNPYAAIVIDPDGNANKPFTIDSGLKELTQAVKGKGDSDDSVLREFFTDDSTDAPVYYYVGKGDKNASALNQNIGEYMVKKVAPIDVHFTYQTDMEHNETKAKKDSKQYNIDMTLNNLSEVYSPYMTQVSATSLSSAKNNGDGTVTLTFDKKITGLDKELDGLKITNDGKDLDSSKIAVQGDGSIKVTMDSSKATTITFNPKNSTIENGSAKENGADSDGKGRTSKNALTYNFTMGNDKTVNFTTSQLVWVFRGYKFLNSNNLTPDEKDGTKFVAQQKSKGKNTGAPERTGDLLSDITHHLRDMQSTGWKITSGDETK